MAYNNAIPAANDRLSQSQSDIQGNFAAIQTLVGINHINFGSANQGKHLYLQLPEHAAPTTAIDEAGFYANVGAASGVTELYFRRENNDATPIPMTETKNVTPTSGWTFLPSGLLLQWDNININLNPTPITFPRPFKIGTVPKFISLTNIQQSTHTDIVQIANVAVTNAGFSAQSRNTSGSFEASRAYMIALGEI